MQRGSERASLVARFDCIKPIFLQNHLKLNDYFLIYLAHSLSLLRRLWLNSGRWFITAFDKNVNIFSEKINKTYANRRLDSRARRWCRGTRDEREPKTNCSIFVFSWLSLSVAAFVNPKSCTRCRYLNLVAPLITLILIRAPRARQRNSHLEQSLQNYRFRWKQF